MILAPTTMAVARNSSKKKNDYRDAITIAKCLASSAYKAVYIPDDKDEDVRDFISIMSGIFLAYSKPCIFTAFRVSAHHVH